MSDISDCYEFTTAYSGFNKFNTGKIGVGFDFTGVSSEKIISKPGDFTKAALYLEKVSLACGTNTFVNLVDGSTGSSILGLPGGSAGANSGEWDFEKDPMKVLEAESTSSLCVSAWNGYVTGFVKAYWGPA